MRHPLALIVVASLACLVAPTTPADAATCIPAGTNYTPASSSQIADGPTCYTTPDTSATPVLAQVDGTKTAADLAAVVTSSPLDPGQSLATGSFVQRDISAAPLAANSEQIAAFVDGPLPDLYLNDYWRGRLKTGVSIGGGVASHDNIPIYTVDSSNPYQDFANFTSTDARVTTFPRLTEVTTGTIPLPDWAKASDGGDRALAVYDVATGIFRGYYGASQDGDGVWHFASAGYFYADPDTGTVGSNNYWLQYLQGTNSVVGIANELTQIGAEELRSGVIGHAVSVTFPSYLAGQVSFPAKQTDGKLASASHPNAPVAGQMFTFPEDFDVEAYIADNHTDRTMAAIMRAVKTYGGIVTDQNFWCMSFNFENPYGMGERAENPDANPWKDDAELAALADFNANAFPWGETAWVEPSYAGHDATVAPAKQLTSSTPTITGTTKVGGTLTAKAGTWTSGTRLTYQWYRDGKKLVGSTKSTFALTQYSLGKRLSVHVTGTLDGFATASTASSRTAAVKTGTLKTAKPTIAGTAKVGSTLTAKVGTWTSGTTWKYQWYRDGKKLKGHTAKTFKLTKYSVGKRLTVRVTGSKPGYTPASTSSSKTAKVKK